MVMMGDDSGVDGDTVVTNFDDVLAGGWTRLGSL